ncbi:MAG: PhnE/PtxC family ABC transporter permease [Clostridia bacterium]
MIDNQIRVRKKRKLKNIEVSDKIIRSLMVLFVLVTLYTLLIRVEYKWEAFNAKVGLNYLQNFFRIDQVELSVQLDMLGRLINTLILGFLTTLTGAFFGLIFGLLGANNLTNTKISNVVKGIASFVRAVPTIIWVLIFVSGFGLTATTAIVGMTFHSFSFFVKSYSESFEEVDKGTIEALKATGANWFQIVFGAVIPSALTKIISWIAIRSEINFTVAVVIGPAVGVPGTIGTMINNAARAGEYAKQGFGILLVFLTAFTMELIISKLRQRSIVSS